jgi:hypothetical protein
MVALTPLCCNLPSDLAAIILSVCTAHHLLPDYWLAAGPLRAQQVLTSASMTWQAFFYE